MSDCLAQETKQRLAARTAGDQKSLYTLRKNPVNYFASLGKNQRMAYSHDSTRVKKKIENDWSYMVVVTLVVSLE
ncbi:hypothetical protein KIN20_001174 [Parelaphostrongylus tenuis]|uniref:Uncharacterized protein n=1 Tax=Parelaphostrongylus tenuis TaxID=148309 RepID=A0AAD5MEE2_PARTN|nr:hypothetical protein KIN20_001174 [Parelaphostrongylus tenuis]